MPGGAKRIYSRRDPKTGVVKKYPIGSPPVLDRLQGQRAFAYSRKTREPVHFREGSIPLEGPDVLGRHSDFPVVGGIDVVVDNPDYDPNEILNHEQLHHSFPWYTPQDKQHAYIEGAMSPDPRVQDATMGALPAEHRSLFEQVLQLKRKQMASK